MRLRWESQRQRQRFSSELLATEEEIRRLYETL